MPFGTVIQFNDIIGTGVIEPDEGCQKISVSYRVIQNNGYKLLNEGQRVEYKYESTPKGMVAKIVVPIY